MSLYVDTSCFLKLLFTEPGSDRVVELAMTEPRLIISALTRLEALVQVKSREVGGTLTGREGDKIRQKLESLLEAPPFESADIPGTAFRAAEQQARASRKGAHCRSLDRLHLAAMESIGVRRLATTDIQQAAAARALGFEVVFPR